MRLCFVPTYHCASQMSPRPLGLATETSGNSAVLVPGPDLRAAGQLRGQTDDSGMKNGTCGLAQVPFTQEVEGDGRCDDVTIRDPETERAAADLRRGYSGASMKPLAIRRGRDSRNSAWFQLNGLRDLHDDDVRLHPVPAPPQRDTLRVQSACHQSIGGGNGVPRGAAGTELATVTAWAAMVALKGPSVVKDRAPHSGVFLVLVSPRRVCSSRYRSRRTHPNQRPPLIMASRGALP